FGRSENEEGRSPYLDIGNLEPPSSKIMSKRQSAIQQQRLRAQEPK
ncbi:11753_t:CDS:1, partial [Dentiscutata heterogama]